MITAASMHVIYFKISPETYYLAATIIDGPRFGAVPMKDMDKHICVLQTSTYIEDGVMRRDTNTSWMSKKMFRKIFKKDMQANPGNYTHLK